MSLASRRFVRSFRASRCAFDLTVLFLGIDTLLDAGARFLGTFAIVLLITGIEGLCGSWLVASISVWVTSSLDS